MHSGINNHENTHFREHYPGSPEAVKGGCICSPVRNQFGNGRLNESGTRLFHPDDECPLHGFEAVFGRPRGRAAALRRRIVPTRNASYTRTERHNP
jgi:hypothetical protein